MSVAKFKGDLKKLAKALDINLGTVVRKIAIDLHGRIVMKTPVDTGRARASWDVSVEEPSSFIPPEGSGFGTPTFPDGLQINGTQTVYIVSNLPYIEALENGHSKRHPEGMVKISLAETEQEIGKLLDEIT